MRSGNLGRRLGLGRVVVVCVLAVGALVGGCGGSESESDGPTQASGGASAGADTAATQAADAVVKQFSARPTQITVTEKIAKPVPSGKKIAIILTVPSTHTLAAVATRAAGVLGWTIKTYESKNTPAGAQAAWDQALRDEPDGIVGIGFPKGTFAKQLAAAESRGIAVVNAQVADTAGDGVDFVLGGGDSFGDYAKSLAAWPIHDAKGKANTVFVTLPTFSILAPVVEQAQAFHKQACPSCEVATLDIPVTAVGKDVPERVVSYIRAHPDTNQVVFLVSTLDIGVPQALRAAGLADKVRLSAGVGDETSYQYLKSGLLGAITVADRPSTAFSLIDVLARVIATGTTDGARPNVPTMIVTQDNQVSTNPEDPVVPTYVEQYKALWGK